jgi:hypothetical protein
MDLENLSFEDFMAWEPNAQPHAFYREITVTPELSEKELKAQKIVEKLLTDKKAQEDKEFEEATLKLNAYLSKTIDPTFPESCTLMRVKTVDGPVRPTYRLDLPDHQPIYIWLVGREQARFCLSPETSCFAIWEWSLLAILEQAAKPLPEPEKPKSFLRRFFHL